MQSDIKVVLSGLFKQLGDEKYRRKLDERDLEPVKKCRSRMISHFAIGAVSSYLGLTLLAKKVTPRFWLLRQTIGLLGGFNIGAYVTGWAAEDNVKDIVSDADSKLSVTLRTLIRENEESYPSLSRFEPFFPAKARFGDESDDLEESTDHEPQATPAETIPRWAAVNSTAAQSNHTEFNPEPTFAVTDDPAVTGKKLKRNKYGDIEYEQ
mmetsp:Transcript_34386/g.88948  ORF Transcript_34386/g.88948 Transcript_34386/m.88948 type:complete len:209 (-) Transcript_34386:4309-4935(-)